MRSANRFPKIDIQAVFEIGALFRTPAGIASAAGEELAENVAESTTAAALTRPTALVHVIRKIEATESHVRILRPSAAGTSRTAWRNIV